MEQQKNKQRPIGKLVQGRFEKVTVQQKEIIALPLAKCRELLNTKEVHYTDVEIERLRTFLYEWAAILYQETTLENIRVISINEQKIDTHEECDYLRTG